MDGYSHLATMLHARRKWAEKSFGAMKKMHASTAAAFKRILATLAAVPEGEGCDDSDSDRTRQNWSQYKRLFQNLKTMGSTKKSNPIVN